MGILKHNDEKQAFRDDRLEENLLSLSANNALMIAFQHRRMWQPYFAHYDKLEVALADIYNETSFDCYYSAPQINDTLMYNKDIEGNTAYSGNAHNIATHYRAPANGIYRINAAAWIGIGWAGDIPENEGAGPFMELSLYKPANSPNMPAVKVANLDRACNFMVNQANAAVQIAVIYENFVFPLHGTFDLYMNKGEECFLKIAPAYGARAGGTPVEISSYGFFQASLSKCMGSEPVNYSNNASFI